MKPISVVLKNAKMDKNQEGTPVLILSVPPASGTGPSQLLVAVPDKKAIKNNPVISRVQVLGETSSTRKTSKESTSSATAGRKGFTKQTPGGGKQQVFLFPLFLLIVIYWICGISNISWILVLM